MSNETSLTPEQASTLIARVFALVWVCTVERVKTFGWLAKSAGDPVGHA